MAASEQLKALVDQMPDPDGRGMYCTDIDKEKIEKAIAEIHKGGRENILGMIDMLVRARQRQRRQAPLRPALPGQLRAADQGREGPAASSPRRWPSQLGGDRSKYMQGYLCQELQWAGGKRGRARLGQAADGRGAGRSGGDGPGGDQGRVRPRQLRAALPQGPGQVQADDRPRPGGAGRRGSRPTPCKRRSTDPDREVRLAAGCGPGASWATPSAVDLLVEGGRRRARLGADPGHQALPGAGREAGGGGRKAEQRGRSTPTCATRSDPSERYIRDAAEKALAGK